MYNKYCDDFDFCAIFFEKISIGIVVYIFSCFLLWYCAAGPTLPFWDDWRYFLNSPMNLFSDFDAFKAQNDTLFTVPLLLDVAIFKLTNFNFAFARYLSLVWLLVYGLFAVLSARIVFRGYARAASILLLSLPLAINGYWDDGTYIAYHQGLPLVFCMISFYILISSLKRGGLSLWEIGLISLLSVFAGLSYISGFIPVMGVGCALLVFAYLEKKEGLPCVNQWRVGLFLIFLALGILAFQFFMVSSAQGSLLEKSHASAVATPFDIKFWIFFLGVIGKGFGFRGNNIAIDAAFAVAITLPLIVLAFKLFFASGLLKNEMPYRLLLMAYIYSLVTIVMYAALVAYGRGGLLPNDNLYLASSVAKARFHHWWISALAPLVISGFVWISLSKALRFFSILMFSIIFIGLGLLNNAGLWDYEKVFSLQKNREMHGIECVRESFSLDKVLCNDLYPMDIKHAIDLIVEEKLWVGDVIRGVRGGGRWQKGSLVGLSSVDQGGHIDFIEVNGESVKIIGWIPLNSTDFDVGLYVDRRLSDVVVSDYRLDVVKRPDVAKILNSGMLDSGFSITFKSSYPLTVDVIKKNFCVYGIKGSRAVVPAHGDGYYCR